MWAIIIFFFLMIIFGAAGNYGGYYRRFRGRRTTPMRGPASGEPLTGTPDYDTGAGWGLAWLWLLIIFIICLAFFGGGHWWWGY